MAGKTARPEAFMAARIQALRLRLKALKLPALLVSNFADVSYLTGFEGDDSFLLVTSEEILLISDSRYEEQIAREAGWVGCVIRKKGILEEVARQVSRLKVSKLGVQSESLTLRQAAALKGLLTGVKLLPQEELVVALRHIKDDHEVALIEHAIAIAEHGFEMLRAEARVGMSENEVASLLTHEMRKRGALNSSFETIVAAGANASLPHYRPGSVKLTSDSAVLVDWGALAAGYRSDLTRMMFIGNIPPAIKEIYQVVLAAQQAAIESIRPGKTGRQIDKVARDLITQAGYGKAFGHGLGHGIGRDIHETISLSRLSTTVLQAGMVVTVEPGIYLPGIGGVRIEDDVLVTPTGYRVLSHLPKDLDSAKIF